MKAKVEVGAEKAGSNKLSVADLFAQNATLRRQQAAIAGFGSFALRQSDLLSVLSEAARSAPKG